MRLGWTVLCAVIWKYLTSLSLRLVLFLYIPSTSIRGWLFSISKLIEPMHFFYIFDVAKNGCSLLAWLIDINKRHHHHAFTSPGTISNEHSGIYNTRRRRTKICWGRNYLYRWNIYVFSPYYFVFIGHFYHKYFHCWLYLAAKAYKGFDSELECTTFRILRDILWRTDRAPNRYWWTNYKGKKII